MKFCASVQNLKIGLGMLSIKGNSVSSCAKSAQCHVFRCVYNRLSVARQLYRIVTWLGITYKLELVFDGHISSYNSILNMYHMFSFFSFLIKYGITSGRQDLTSCGICGIEGGEQGLERS